MSMTTPSVIKAVEYMTIRDMELGYRVIDVSAQRLAGAPRIVADSCGDDPKRLNMIGEIRISYIRQKKEKLPEEGRIPLDYEPPTWVSKQFYTEPGLTRFLLDYYPETLHRRAVFMNGVVANSKELADNLAIWHTLGEEKQRETARRLQELHFSLINRVDARLREPAINYHVASGVTDALGRLNPAAMSVKTAASTRRVELASEQVKLNEGSLRKLQSNLREMQSLRVPVIEAIWRWLEQPAEAKRASQIQTELKNLIWKPYIFPACLGLHTLGSSTPTEAVFTRIRRAFFAELALTQYDAVLAQIEDNIDLFQGSQITLTRLLSELFGLEVPEYTELGRLLSSYYRRLGSAFLLADKKLRAKQMRNTLRTMRSIIRFRYDPSRPRTVIWLPPAIEEKYVAA